MNYETFNSLLLNLKTPALLSLLVSTLLFGSCLGGRHRAAAVSLLDKFLTETMSEFSLSSPSSWNKATEGARDGETEFVIMACCYFSPETIDNLRGTSDTAIFTVAGRFSTFSLASWLHFDLKEKWRLICWLWFCFDVVIWLYYSYFLYICILKVWSVLIDKVREGSKIDAFIYYSHIIRRLLYWIIVNNSLFWYSTSYTSDDIAVEVNWVHRSSF